MTLKCRGCLKTITAYVGTYWDENEECSCPAGGEHMPMRVTVLTPQEAWNTLMPIAKRRDSEKTAIPCTNLGKREYRKG